MSREPYRWQELANYNGEVHRGIKHTPEYDARMAQEQAAFNAEREAEIRAKGGYPIGDGLWLTPRRERWWRRLWRRLWRTR